MVMVERAPSRMPLEIPYYCNAMPPGQRLALAILTVKLLKLKPPPLTRVLCVPETSRVLVLADFLNVVIFHLTALLLVLFLALHFPSPFSRLPVA